MDLRQPIKHILRMCGHAFVITVHERIDALERQVNDLSLQIASLAENQESLLRAAILLVEGMRNPDAQQPKVKAGGSVNVGDSGAAPPSETGRPEA